MKFPLSMMSGVVVAAVIALPLAAQAQSRMKECAAEWKQAKAANTTAGKTYREFSKECMARTSAAPAAPAAPATPAAAKPETKPAAAAPAASDKPGKGGREAMLARQRACGAEWKADKAAGKTGSMKWPQYWSECNTRKKAQGM